MFYRTENANTSKAARSAAPSSFSAFIYGFADITKVMSVFFFPIILAVLMLMPMLLPLTCIMPVIMKNKLSLSRKP